MKRLLAALLALFLAVPAVAQVNPQNLPANSVYGRLGIGSGPGQAIPLATIFSQFTLPAPWVDIRSGANGCAAAAGNGVTDDSAAIQCQINFVSSTYSGGFVYVPHGNYQVNSTVTVKKGVILLGTGPGGSFITATSDINVIKFDSSCTQGGGMEGIFVSGYFNAGATQDVVVVQGTSCSVLLRDNYIWGGHHALNTAGSDGHYEDNFFCGWTGNNVYSTGANWYGGSTNKLDSCGNPSTANGFEQGASAGIAENQIVNMDISCGTCTNSIVINDGSGTKAVTKFSNVVTSKPVLITNGKFTAFNLSEFGSTTFTGAGAIDIAVSYGINGTVTPSGGAYSCSANTSITCPNLNFTATLGADVTTTTQNTYYDGPSIAQGTAGTWLVTGNATVAGSSTNLLTCKLWDGTTLISSGAVQISTSAIGTVSLSGMLTAPAGNLRISCSNTSANGGTIKKTNGIDNNASTITATRLY